MEWCTLVVPTYPEGGSHALQVCQHHHQVERVGHSLCCRVVRDARNTLLATAPADSAETFTVPQRTVCERCATVKVAGGDPSVHTCAVLALNRVQGINKANPLRILYLRVE
jgi:hypothetical protein